MEAGEEDRERQAPFRRLPTIAQQQLGTVGGTQIFNGLCDAAISSGPLFQSWRTAALDFYVYLACVCRTLILLSALGQAKRPAGMRFGVGRKLEDWEFWTCVPEWRPLPAGAQDAGCRGLC